MKKIALIIFCNLVFLHVLYAETEKGLRDPTRPPNFQGEFMRSLGQWSVNMIFSAPHAKHALVNGKFVEIGDEVNGYKVTDITDNTVELANKSKIILLKLDSDVKQSIKSEVTDTPDIKVPSTVE